LIDDALDYFGDTEKLGKPIGGDFIDGKVTMPLIIGLSRCNTSEREFIERNFGQNDIDNYKLNSIIHILKNYYAWDDTLLIANRISEEAKESLKTLPLCIERKILENLLTAIVSRNR